MKTKSIMMLLLSLSLSGIARGGQQPNIVFIFADDMGVGDVSHTTGKAPTPYIDRLAAQGMRFTDAHTSSSVCTPSRYSLLTGRYNWRTRLQKSVFFNPHDTPLIKENEATVASLLNGAGYHTACIGKWHLGIGWQFNKDFQRAPEQKGQGWDIDYSLPAVTATANGFDYFYGIQASLDMAPYIYIENDRAVSTPTVTKGFNRNGAACADFEVVDCLKTFAEKSVAYIKQRAEESEPFFLYLPLTSPHTPIVPSRDWQGKSDIGKYGDFLMETDWVVGEVLKALDKHGLTKNTLVIFSTDNGCSPAANIKNLTNQGHKPNADWRGHKADIFEGGHRVPFIVSWPGVVKPGTVTDRLTCTTDFIATCAEIVGEPLANDAGVDSVSFLPTLKNAKKVKRAAIVHHSINGEFAIRQGQWKLCLCPGSGGWSAPRGKATQGMPGVQLYDLDADPGETSNLWETHPEKIKELTELLYRYVDQGRSTDGPKQANDVTVKIKR